MSTVLITGTSSGLGRGLAEVFRDKHWDVIATTRKELDISEQKFIDEFVNSLGDKPIDVLINNAGVYDSTAVNYEDVVSTMDDVDAVFRTNAIGPRILTEKLVSNLEKSQLKLIVTITSGMGTHSQMSSYSAKHWPYSASKAAADFEMSSFALVHPKIKSVLIHPGSVISKIGGEGASVEPRDAAEKILDLIENHEVKLPNGKLVNTEGKVIEF